MSDDAAMPGDGNIPIRLDGKDHELVPSMAACIAISRIAGGLNAASARVLALDIETVCSIIIAGLGLNPTQAKMVPEAVYRTGLIQLAAPCVDFIRVVANGGRALSDDDDDQEGEQSPNPLMPASL